MKASTIKLTAVLILHVILYACFYLLVRVASVTTFESRDIVFSVFFSVLYFGFVWHDLYSRPYHHYLKNAFSFTLRDLIICSFILIAVEYAYFIVFPPADLVNAFISTAILVLFYAVAHVFQYIWIIHLANLGFFSKNVMLIGKYDDRLPVENLFQNINNTKTFLGQLVRDGERWKYRTDFNSPTEEITKSFSDFLFSHKVNELIICLDGDLSSEAIHEAATWCRQNSVGYYLVPDISVLPRAWPWQARFSVIPEIERYCPNRDSLIMVSVKRMLDIIVSGFGLIILSPVMLVVALLIKSEDGGQVFYISDRVGIHGKLIRFVKFRSMVPDAENQKNKLMSLNERPDGPLFKLANDPRVTKIGRFIRKTSLDEIPQLWNVLKGDMSLIGPRPHLPNEVAAYSDADNLRLECIPGISCLPQIYGRDTLGFREWVDYDLQYRKEWSLWFDFKILFLTVGVVLKPFFSHKSA